MRKISAIPNAQNIQYSDGYVVKINDKPILYYVIEHLLKYNINNINVASGYKSTILKNYLDTHPFKANIKIYDSGDVDIIKRIQGIMKEVKKDVLILYGDTISDVNIFELIQFHRKSSKKMTMTDIQMLEALKTIAKEGRSNKIEVRYKVYREAAPWSIHAKTVYEEAVKELVEGHYKLRMVEGELLVDVD